jgi:hypothetical protein
MAERTQYHLLSEDNRPSLDSIRGDDERLLDPADDGEDQPPPKKGNELCYSYHPTLIIRLLNVILLSIMLAFYIVCHQYIAIAAILFTCIALLRNILVLFHHFVARWIRFHIEIVGSSRSINPGKAPAWLQKWSVQVVLDLFVVVTLLISVIVALKGGNSYRRWWNRNEMLLTPACVLGLIVMLVPPGSMVVNISANGLRPLQALAAFDLGNPTKFTVKGHISLVKDKTPKDNALVSQSYSDIEATQPEPQMIDRGSPLAVSPLDAQM